MFIFYLTFNVFLLIPGFTGTNCQVNIDECTDHVCENGGRCVDGVLDYTCDCTPEWTGKY